MNNNKNNNNNNNNQCFLFFQTELTYDSVKSMSYMNMVVCETLRLYPVAAR